MFWDENNEESDDSVVSGIQQETGNIEAEDVTFVAVWQPHGNPEPEEEYEWSDADIDPPQS